MELDPDEPVDLCRVCSSFEADTIAACLRDRGFHACALTLVARTVQWEGGITNAPRVQIPRCELADARAVLAAVKEQAKSIDWDHEIRKSLAGLSGAVCTYCEASREGLNMDIPCTMCGKSPAQFDAELPHEEFERRQLRSKYLLYLGIGLIALPFFFRGILMAIGRVL